MNPHHVHHTYGLKLDNTENELDGVSSDGYPTLKFFKKGDDKTVNTLHGSAIQPDIMLLSAADICWGA